MSSVIEPYVVRTSERATFKKCRQLWDFNSAIRLSREPVKPDKNLAFGIDGHKGLEAYYNPETWEFPNDIKLANAILAFKESNANHRKVHAEAVGELGQEEELEYKEREELGVAMLTNYAKWAPSQDDFTPISVEEVFQVPVLDSAGTQLTVYGRPVVYQVRIDLVLKDKDGLLWILDHKTASRFEGLNFLQVDTQIPSYAWAFQQRYGIKVAGVVYNELRKAAPHPPKTLQSGKLSVDKSQSTTYQLYMEEIEKQGLDKGAYEGILEYLRNQPNSYFRRTPVTKTQAELKSQIRYIAAEAQDMLGSPAIYPNPTKINCEYCSFLVPCTIRTEGGDEMFALNDSRAYRGRTSDS